MIFYNCLYRYLTYVVFQDEEYVPEYIDAGERLPHLPLVVIKQEKPEVGMHMQKILVWGGGTEGGLNPTTRGLIISKG
jgi:hypothetical protein